MPVSGLHHFNLRADADTLIRLRDFYIDVVGLKPGYRPPFKSAGYWLYAGDAAVLHLSHTTPGEDRPVSVLGTFDHVAFAAHDHAACLAALIAHNVPFSQDVIPATQQRQVFFNDPAGNGVELNFHGE
jgi:catechol-2,3-dioxygenase